MTEKNKDLKCSMDLRIKSEDDRKGESGRSMVEMLGTLAIIGVLSVGGIAGYTYAMDKHYANELLMGASERAVLVTAQIVAGKTPNLNEFAHYSNVGGTFGQAEKLEDGSGFIIPVSGVKGAVCENLIKATEGTDITISQKAEDNTLTDMTAENCDDDNPNGLAFVYKTGNGESGSDTDAYGCQSNETYNHYLGKCIDLKKGLSCVTDGDCPASDDDYYYVCCQQDLGVCAYFYCDSDVCTCPASSDLCPNGSEKYCETNEETGEEECICPTEDSCSNNNDCDDDEYCNLDSSDVWYIPAPGTCETLTAGEPSVEEGIYKAGKFLIGPELSWWSSHNWCEAHGKRMITFDDVGLERPSDGRYCEGCNDGLFYELIGEMNISVVNINELDWHNDRYILLASSIETAGTFEAIHTTVCTD